MQLSFRLSLRDPKQPDKYLGTDEIWETSENALRDVLNNKGVAFTEELGEAAFYGPKIDFTAKDSLGRTWQLATLQLDFNIPKRFTLTYTDEDGNTQTPVMIHRAITGSLERFIAILIEHFAGALPLWLSPTQVRIVSVSEGANTYAKEIEALLRNEQIRAEVDVRDLTVGKKIREGEEEKIPVLTVVGERESQQRTLAVRFHGGKDGGAKPIDEVVAFLKNAVHKRE
jgi:threonyl-tRNA synthetase